MAVKFDLRQLAWSPSTDDEREQLRRRTGWFTYFPQLTDDDAIALLRQILALRRRRLRSRDADRSFDGEKEAQRLAAKLVEGAAGWAFVRESQVHLLYPRIPEPFDPDLRRVLAITCLKMPLPLMPMESRSELASALDALEDGSTQSILQRRKGGRRGVGARTSAWIELELLQWIEWQTEAHLVKTKAEALSKIGHLCGRITSQAVSNWKRGLVAFFGEERVEAALAKAATVGRMQANGTDPATDPELGSVAADLQSLDVETLARERRKAKQKRSRH